MKKIFFLPVILFFAACQLPDSDGATKKELLAKFHVVTFPAVQKIVDYRMQWQNAQLKMLTWINTPGASGSKTKLKLFVEEGYPKMESGLKEMEQPNLLTKDDGLDSLITTMKEEIIIYKRIMDDLSTVVQYNDPSTFLPDEGMVLDNDGVCAVAFEKIDRQLERLAKRINSIAEQQLQDLSK